MSNQNSLSIKIKERKTRSAKIQPKNLPRAATAKRGEVEVISIERSAIKMFEKKFTAVLDSFEGNNSYLT